MEPNSQAQLDLHAQRRVRDRLVAECTALINQIRALLLERGIIETGNESWRFKNCT